MERLVMDKSGLLWFTVEDKGCGIEAFQGPGSSWPAHPFAWDSGAASIISSTASCRLVLVPSTQTRYFVLPPRYDVVVALYDDATRNNLVQQRRLSLSTLSISLSLHLPLPASRCPRLFYLKHFPRRPVPVIMMAPGRLNVTFGLSQPWAVLQSSSPPVLVSRVVSCCLASACSL
ncbi:hypothetical protein BKA81DRAFT_51369 [Phyllosticta paracitricarpa]